MEICRCSSAVGAGLLKDLIASHADELCKVLKIALETRNEQKFNEVTESAGFECVMPPTFKTPWTWLSKAIGACDRFAVSKVPSTQDQEEVSLRFSKGSKEVLEEMEKVHPRRSGPSAQTLKRSRSAGGGGLGPPGRDTMGARGGQWSVPSPIVMPRGPIRGDPPVVRITRRGLPVARTS